MSQSYRIDPTAPTGEPVYVVRTVGTVYGDQLVDIGAPEMGYEAVYAQRRWWKARAGMVRLVDMTDVHLENTIRWFQDREDAIIRAYEWHRIVSAGPDDWNPDEQPVRRLNQVPLYQALGREKARRQVIREDEERRLQAIREEKRRRRGATVKVTSDRTWFPIVDEFALVMQGTRTTTAETLAGLDAARHTVERLTVEPPDTLADADRRHLVWLEKELEKLQGNRDRLALRVAVADGLAGEFLLAERTRKEAQRDQAVRDLNSYRRAKRGRA